MLHAPLPSSVPDRVQNRAETNVGLGVGNSGSMLGILCTFWGMGFLIYEKKDPGSFFLPGVMWAKNFLLKAGTAGCLGCELNLELKLTRTSFWNVIMCLEL